MSVLKRVFVQLAADALTLLDPTLVLVIQDITLHSMEIIQIHAMVRSESFTLKITSVGIASLKM